MERLTEEALAALEYKVSQTATRGPWEWMGPTIEELKDVEHGEKYASPLHIRDDGNATYETRQYLTAVPPSVVAALIAEVREHRRREQELKAALEAAQAETRKVRAEADARAAEIEAAAREWARAEAFGVAAEVADSEINYSTEALAKADERRDEIAHGRFRARIVAAKAIQEEVQSFAKEPTTPAERLTLVGHHLRAAKALCEEVASDASATPEEETAAQYIRRGLLEPDLVAQAGPHKA